MWISAHDVFICTRNRGLSQLSIGMVASFQISLVIVCSSCIWNHCIERQNVRIVILFFSIFCIFIYCSKILHYSLVF